MDSSTQKPHAVCIPLPAQGHINPMLKLAKLLHSRGFHITFVHTEFNYDRLIKSNGAASMELADDFRFETVSDGLPPGNPRGILDLPALCVSMPIHCKQSFKQLIARLLSPSPGVPPVTCIVSDGVMSFTLKVAEEFGIPEILFFTPSACGMLGYFHFGELRERGYFPLKDESCLKNGFLDTVIDWIPAMKGIRLKDLPTFIRTTNNEDIMFNYNLESVNNALNTRSIILNTFDDLEQEVLDAIKEKIPGIYTIGPLATMHSKLSSKAKLDNTIGSSLWKEDKSCLEWLDKKEPGSVVNVNFGSLVIMTPEQLSEFAWGLANSKYPFVWVIRPDLVHGGAEIIQSREFMEEISGRGLILEWCPQEEVLSHASVGGFLTHCGWNSTLESIAHGVPMLCWPFFAEQQMNCRYIWEKWGIGMEIDVDVKREDVEGLVRELMEGEKGKEIRRKAMGLKILADRAINPGGSTYISFERLVNHLKGVPISDNPLLDLSKSLV